VKKNQSNEDSIGLYIDVPAKMYMNFSEICKYLGITKREGILRYLRWVDGKVKYGKVKAVKYGVDETFSLLDWSGKARK